MSNTIRIRTTPNGGDNYVKVNVDQDFDFIEILSLKISQEETYRKFCSDYGAIVGRVIINNGFGVPNAKVSVFIPIDENDREDTKIFGLYPYENVTDRNSDGIRYNLLPQNNENGDPCFTPVGSFPSKREVLDDDTLLEVYCKYYKYTTTTNHAGDFMIFGVPIGTYTIHVDADISDIGFASQKPYDLIRQGTPEKFFESPTKFKKDANLDRLVQIKTANVGVNVQPFWGDLDNCEIGFTRADINLNYTLSPAAIFMGSIHTDQGKLSINKQCRPRKKIGDVCSQVVGAGTIEMIRKNVDGEIGDFFVDGGRLIDEDGTWAFQIPMNLDYVATDEFGNLQLTNDPNIGIPTRASMRFRIGMDQTGAEGRLRTMAKYLVPNNPRNQNEIDYEFGESTKDSSFKDLYWNKIYTVSNFISRYQKTATGVKTRNMVGIKDVDGCVGDKNPPPYNRVNTEGNPIFFILCLLITIFASFIFLINSIIIPLINLIISVINLIIDVVNAISFGALNISQIGYVPCISVRCPSEDGAVFAPGCQIGSDGFNASQQQINYVNLDGLSNCLAFEMATSLDMYKFDFYNDWLNGSLYAFLLKYKRRGRGTEKFCEYDCSDFINDPNYSGVDGNNNGVKDNECFNEKLIDSCVPCNGGDCQNEARESPTIREGLIKKYNDEFYYASTTHNSAFKLYATDIICLGSTSDCDWQGFPKLQPYLTQTSYILPPEIQELSDDGTTILESGMVDIGGTTQGLYFSIDCLGLHSNKRQVLNVRHACEMFVDTDEAIIDQLTNVILSQANGNLGSSDIDDGIGNQVRDAFVVLNSGSTSSRNYVINPNMNTNFNIGNIDDYDFTSYSDNGTNYINFRGYTIGSSQIYSQPKHSFYMYFGMIPNKTALDKMNERYFTPCPIQVDTDFTINTSSISDFTGNFSGQMTINFIGSEGPFTFTINGPNYYYFSGLANNVNDPVLVNGLAEGVYVIVGQDVFGNTVTKSVTIGGPTPLFCLASVTKDATSIGVSDGEITISSIGGGVPPYSFELVDNNGNPDGIPSSGINVVSPMVIQGLSRNNVGYTLTVRDSELNECVTTGLTVGGPSAISLGSTVTPTTCYNGNDGSIQISYSGGQAPYTLTTTGPAGYISSLQNMVGLTSGLYSTTVIDSLNDTASITSIITSNNPQLTIQAPSITELSKQCNSNQYVIPFYITNGLAPNDTAYLEYMLDGNGTWNRVSVTYNGQNTPMYLNILRTDVTHNVLIRFSNSPNYSCFSNNIVLYIANMPLPTINLNGSIVRTGQVGAIYTYEINASGGVGSLIGSPIDIGIYDTNSASITTTITDSVGCTITLNYP